MMTGHERTMTLRARSETGTTLIETAIATAILLVTMTGLLGALSIATAITENEGHLSARTAEYAQDKMEQLLSLAYLDAVSDTTVIPTAIAGGTGLTIGGSVNPSAPAAQFFDYLGVDGTPLCPCAGTSAPPGWFYERVWQVSNPAGTVNLKQITVTATVSTSLGNAIRPTSTVTSLKSSPF